MKWELDRNVFMQIGLDSGALTILGSVVHSFAEPGVYRGSVHRPDGGQAVFYVEVDKESPAASAQIDLAKLAGYTTPRLSAAAGMQEEECCCCEGEDDETGNRFAVNPRGYVVFHVSQGAGGYSVHVRRARDEREGNFGTNQPRQGEGRDRAERDDRRPGREEAVFNSQQLGEGDFYAATILRPGTYQVTNSAGQAKGAVVVSYPQPGKEPYRPPDAVHVQVGRERMDPQRVELKPGQGLIFDIKQGPARIVVQLLRPDDGPGNTRGTRPRGWRKPPAVVEGGRERGPRDARLPDEDPAPQTE